MKYAFISDIHANELALSHVLENIKEDRVDKIICLGDIVGFHTAPGKCIDILADNNVSCIAGNHDEGVRGTLDHHHFPKECWEAIVWTKRQLTSGQMGFLRSLLTHKLIDDQLWIMHGIMNRTHRYLVGYINLCYVASKMSKAGIHHTFHGHTHRMTCYSVSGAVIPTIVRKLEDPDSLCQEPRTYYFMNPGSVGQPRSIDTRARYIVFDTDTNGMQWKKISYDYGTVIEQTLGIFPSHLHFYNKFHKTNNC